VLALIDGPKSQAAAQLPAVASLGWDIRFSAPVLADDRLQATFTSAAKRPARDGQRGIVVLDVEARNQAGLVVQAGSTTLMLLP
jgi:acyl dehydratase